MDFVEPIPEELEPHIRDELQPGELLMVLLAADLQANGMYGKSWFALTDERLLVFHSNGGSQPDVRRIALGEVQKIQTKNYVGNGALVVELEKETVELVRFSRSAFYKFSGVPQAVEAAGLQETAGEEEVEQASGQEVEHCHTCGRALRPGSKICYNCIRKTETFWR